MSAKPLKVGDEIEIRRPWGRTKAVTFEGIVLHKDRRRVQVAYRAQVYWAPCGGRYDIELEHGQLMRSPSKPFDPPWSVDDETLARLIERAQAEAEARKQGVRK